MSTDQDAVASYFRQFRRLLAVHDGPQWKPVTEKLGVRVSQLNEVDASGVAVVKGVGLVKAAPRQTMDFVFNIENRPKWDTFFDSGRLVKWIEQQGKVSFCDKWQTQD